MEKLERKPWVSATNSDFNNDFNRTPENKSYLLTSKIIKALQEKGLNKSAFAQLMNVQPSVITKWLSGNHNFTIETLFEIEKKLNVDLFAIPNTNFETIKMQTTAHGNVPVVFESNLKLVSPNDGYNIKYSNSFQSLTLLV